jgi:predicted porin
VFETAISNDGSQTSVVSGNNATSEVSVGVSEDLGNGLKAMAATSICFNAANGSSSAGMCGAPTAGSAKLAVGPTYNSYVGVSSADFGTLKIGQQFSNTFFASAAGDVFGRGLGGSPVGAAHAQIANSVNYTSPSISGVSVSYQQSLESAVKTYTSYAINYSNGALSAGFASGKLDTTTENVIGASYDFGMAKLYAGSGTTTGKKNQSTFGVSVPFGAISLAAATSTTDAGATQNTFGATYALSKRTSAFLTNTDTSTTAPINYVGIRHNF